MAWIGCLLFAMISFSSCFASDNFEDENRQFIIAFMPGKVVKLGVEPGQFVKVGDELLTLEAMKMQMVIRTGFEGYISNLAVQEGSLVTCYQKLLKIIPQLEEEGVQFHFLLSKNEIEPAQEIIFSKDAKDEMAENFIKSVKPREYEKERSDNSLGIQKALLPDNLQEGVTSRTDSAEILQVLGQEQIFLRKETALPLKGVDVYDDVIAKEIIEESPILPSFQVSSKYFIGTPGLLRRYAPRNDKEKSVIASEAKQSRNALPSILSNAFMEEYEFFRVNAPLYFLKELPQLIFSNKDFAEPPKNHPVREKKNDLHRSLPYILQKINPHIVQAGAALLFSGWFIKNISMMGFTAPTLNSLSLQRRRRKLKFLRNYQTRVMT